jgi:Fe-S-cluster containining protein
LPSIFKNGNRKHVAGVTNQPICPKIDAAMLKLSEQQQADLRNAFDASLGLAGLVDAVADVYRAFDAELQARKPRCDASGRCCRFEAYGHRLFVSLIELIAFQASRQVDPSDPWDGTGCPFQKAGRCSVHAARPFGCRVYFCDPTSVDWQTTQYEQFHARLKELHGRFGVPYMYVEWREALTALGVARASGSSPGETSLPRGLSLPQAGL